MSETPEPRRTSLFSFSLRTFLLLVAALCVFLAGRASNHSLRIGGERPIGDWKMEMKAGWERQAVIVQTPDGFCELKAAGTVFNGISDLQGDELVMKSAESGTNKNFVWHWDGAGWLLVGDLPKQQYNGSRLVPWGYNERKNKAIESGN